jgi:hypothetical protein
MEFDLVKTGIVFLVLFGVIGVGTVMSPMDTGTVAMVLVGIGVFGVVSLWLGVKHGEFRAQN